MVENFALQEDAMELNALFVPSYIQIEKKL